MKSRAIAAAVLAAATCSAFAQGQYPNSGSAENHGGIERYPGWGAYPPWSYVPQPDTAYPRGWAYANPGRVIQYGVAPGMVLPGEYLERQYLVRNWRRQGLSAPPAGYEWRRIGSQYVLVARSDGRVAQLLR